jgi:WD40 repeat protein
MVRRVWRRPAARVVAPLACVLLLCGIAGAQLSILWKVPDADPYTFAAFSHSGSILAVGRAGSNTSEFLNAADGSLIRTFSGQHNGTNVVVFSLDDAYLINGIGQGGSTLTIASWIVSTGQRFAGPLGDHNNGTNSLSLSPDGQYVATSGNFGRDINIRHVPDLAVALNIPNTDPHTPGLNPRVKSVSWSPDGQLVASSDAYGIKARRPFDGSLVYSIDAAEARSIAYSPDGLYLAAAIESEQAVKIFKASNGKFVRALPIGGTFEFPVIAFSPNGRVLVAGYDVGDDSGALKFWNVSNGAPLFSENRSGAIISTAFSPGGERIAFTQFDGLIVMAKAPRTDGSR